MSPPKPVVDLVEGAGRTERPQGHSARDRKVFLSGDYKEEKLRAGPFIPDFEPLGRNMDRLLARFRRGIGEVLSYPLSSGPPQPTQTAESAASGMTASIRGTSTMVSLVERHRTPLHRTSFRGREGRSVDLAELIGTAGRSVGSEFVGVVPENLPVVGSIETSSRVAPAGGGCGRA